MGQRCATCLGSPRHARLRPWLAPAALSMVLAAALPVASQAPRGQAAAPRALRASASGALQASAIGPQPAPLAAAQQTDDVWRFVQAPEQVPPFRTNGKVEGGEALLGPPAEAGEGAAVRRWPRFGGRLPPELAGPAGRNPEVEAVYGRYVDRFIDPQTTLDLVVSRPRLLVFKQPPIRYQLADDKLASALLISPTELSLTGNQVGSTVLNLWFADPDTGDTHVLSYLVRVFEDPHQRLELDRLYEALEAEINRAFPDSQVDLALVGDKIVVRGEAHDVVEAAQILRLVSVHAPDAQQRPASIEQINFLDRTPFMPVNPGDVALGPLEQPDAYASDVLRSVLAELSPQVVNMLRVPGEQQVMLRVTVAEVNRSAARSIGLNFSIANDRGVPVFSQLTGNMTQPNLPAFLDNGQVFLAIEALRSLNMAKALAEPNLVTLNGQPARFRAGGQFPVPASQLAFGGVGQGVAFVPFGVQLQFIPYITDRDRVRLHVAAIVSTRDEGLGTNIGGSPLAGGTAVSGLQARSFQTSVELREGQTLAVAGLLQTNFSASTTRIPLWGDLPLIGHTGGRSNTTSDEQELVILITPELVHPLPACHTPALPGDDMFEPSDVEFFLGNRLEGRRAHGFRSAARTDWHRLTAYRRCEDRWIIGPQGHSYGCCPACESDLPPPCPQYPEESPHVSR